MLNIENKSDEELIDLRTQIDSELNKRALKKRQEARKKIIEIAKMNKIDLGVLAKEGHNYRNPDNQFETWSGRGRQPKWVKEQLANGKLLKDLEML